MPQHRSRPRRSSSAPATSRLWRLLLGLLLVSLCGLLRTAAAQPRSTTADTALSDRRVAYVIDAVLQPTTRSVQGQMRLTWRNPGRVPVDTLQLHLYLNAFSNPRTTFMRESGGQHRGYAASADAWGGIDVQRMAIAEGPRAGADLTTRLRFIQPDDNNPHDSTVAAVALPEPVPPGRSITLAIDFAARLPKIFARTGWEERADGTPFFMVAQWFPKLGVYEVPGQRYVPEDAGRGRWSTHQFHANSEFYADFGTYDVTITVPRTYKVGATGVRTAESTTDSTRTLTYRAEDVHDFAWTASPAFLELTEQWRHVELRLLLQPEHADQAGRHFEAAQIALERFDAWVGPYPYTTLTLVDGLGGANGMEYPTLITCGTAYMMPSWVHLPELVTIHEFGHQYFYGLLASNEAEEAWLDEGINSYLEARIVDAAYGPGGVLDFPGLRISDFAMQHLLYAENAPSRGPIYAHSWAYPYGDYGKASYAKPATVLRTLERYLGWPVMQEILQTYYQRWRFRHPTTEDFIQVVEDVSGEDLDWFFDQFIYGTAVVDYAVASISSQRIAGVEDEAPAQHRSRVTLHRKADGVFPQTLRVRFADGSADTLEWNGQDEWKRFTFERPARLVEAYLDPERIVWLDVDHLNNRRVREADTPLARKQQLKVAVWLQQFFYLVAGLF